MTNISDRFEGVPEVRIEENSFNASSLSSSPSMCRKIRLTRVDKGNAQVVYNQNLQRNATWTVHDQVAPNKMPRAIFSFDDEENISATTTNCSRRNISIHREKLLGKTNYDLPMQMMTNKHILVDDECSTTYPKRPKPSPPHTKSDAIDVVKSPFPATVSSLSLTSLNETNFTLRRERESSKSDGKHCNHRQNNENEMIAHLAARRKDSYDGYNGYNSTTTAYKIKRSQGSSTKRQKNNFGDAVKKFPQDSKEHSLPLPTKSYRFPSCELKKRPTRKTSFHRIIVVAEYCERDMPSVVSFQSSFTLSSSVRKSNHQLEQLEANAKENNKIWSTTSDRGLTHVDMNCYHQWSIRERYKTSHNATWWDEGDEYRNRNTPFSTARNATTSYYGSRNGCILQEQSKIQGNIFGKLINNFSQQLKIAAQEEMRKGPK